MHSHQFSPNFQTSSNVFILQTSADGRSQSPNIHTHRSRRGHRNHQSLLCLDWTHSSRCPAHSKSQYWEGPNSSGGGAGMRCRILWLRKERVEWGSRVVRPSKSFIQSPTLWGRGKFSRGLKVMQFAVTNTAILFTRIKFCPFHVYLIGTSILSVENQSLRKGEKM